jgi:hypothetical protein
LLLAGYTAMAHAQASAANAAGATPAKLDVSASGGATYSIPIAVPHGIGNLQPDLTLRYDSQTGRGIAGPGWSLQGVSAIKRCQQLPTRDVPAAQALTLTGTDRFCLDGARLVLDGTAKAYGADGAVYRQVIDNFSRVTSRGVAGTGPQQFTVEARNGLVTEYGATADSRVLPGKAQAGDIQPATVVMWSIDKISDRYGNTVNFAYAADTISGSQVLSQITYNNGLAYVKFTYTDDPNPRGTYLAGTRLTSSMLLTDITTYVRDDANAERQVRHYVLAYDRSDAKGDADAHPIARLVSVSDCGADNVCLGDIRFDWAAWSSADAKLNPSHPADPSKRLVTGGGSVGITDGIRQPRTFADMNGDGKADPIAFKSDGVYVLFSTGQAGDGTYAVNPTRVTTDFESASTWWDVSVLGEMLPRHLVDMNGDGFPDIVGFHPDTSRLGHPNPSLGPGIYVALWDPVALKYKPATLAAGSSHPMLQTGNWGRCSSLPSDPVAPRYLVDMDKDGIPDILGINQNGIYISYGAVDGSGNITFKDPGAAVSDRIKMYDNGAFSLQNYLSIGCDMNVRRQPIYTADMNGDGYPDLVAITVNGVYVLIWDPVNKTFLPATPAFTGIKAVYTSQGVDHPTYLYDMNGDGYPDLVNFSPSGVTVSLWSGTGFLPATVWTTEFGTNAEADFSKNPHRVADMNGDGYPDIVDFRNDGVYVGLSDGQGKIFPATRWTTEFTAQGKDSTGNTWGAETDTPRELVDVDGDGLPDVVGFGDQQVRWAAAVGPAGPRIIKVTDARGAVDYVQYSVAVDHAGFYTSDSPTSVTWPRFNVRTPLPVVSKLSESDGIGGFHSTRYRYGGRRTSVYDGDLGFRWMAAWDEPTQVDTLTYFVQDYPMIGRVGLQEVHRNAAMTADYTAGCSLGSRAICVGGFVVGSGQTIRSTLHTWNNQELASAGEYPSLMRQFVFEATSRAQSWELDGTTLPLRQESFSYDEPILVPGTKQWGNLTRHVLAYADGTQVTTDDTYEPALESSWRIGRLSQSTVTSVRPARIVNVGPPADAPQTPDKAPPYTPKPGFSAALLSIITSYLLDN